MSESIEMPVDELSGAALDWAVLFALNGEGPDWKIVNGVFGVVSLRDVRVGLDGVDQMEDFHAYSPSVDWSITGPLIESNRITLSKKGSNEWYADKVFPWEADQDDWCASGPTALVATCRAIVQGKLGDEVNVPAMLAAAQIGEGHAMSDYFAPLLSLELGGQAKCPHCGDLNTDIAEPGEEPAGQAVTCLRCGEEFITAVRELFD